MKRARAALLLGVTLASATAAHADQVRPRARSREEPGLRAHVGVGLVRSLLRSDSSSERLHGVARASGLGTPEAVTALADAIERSAPMRADARAVLAVARALARHRSNERAISGLVAIVTMGDPVSTKKGSDMPDDPDPSGRVDLARVIAARALARSNAPKALEALTSLVRIASARDSEETTTNMGSEAALNALSTYPPRDPTYLASADLPVSLVTALARSGDLRALSRLFEIARTADAATRASILTVLGEAGDHRALSLARAAESDRDPRARIAAAEAFSRLGSNEAVRAVNALLADDESAEAALW